MEWVKTILNAVRVAVDGVSAQIERLKSRVKSVEDWVKSLDWVPVVKPVDETLLPETTLDYDDGATFTAPMPTVGLTYTVTIGEKTYEAEAWRYSTEDLSAVCIGKYILDADSTGQFIFLWGLGDAAGQRTFITAEGVTDGKVTVSIARKSENENELPDVFLWSLKKRIAKNESAISDTSTKITELEESVNTATDDVSSMKTTVKSLQTSLSNKADKSSPVFTGSFSQNRKAGTTIGHRSHVEGDDCQAIWNCGHAEGSGTKAMGLVSHSEGGFTTANGEYSHSEGHGTEANGEGQHVEGRYNIPDKDKKYAHIVGNGKFVPTGDVYSNAHTLDWAGVPWFQGRPQFGGNAQDDGSQSVVANGDKEFILASSTEGSTKKFKVTVDDSGTLKATEITN